MFKNLTIEKVRDLSEEEVFELMKRSETEVSKEERSTFLRLISLAFEFRSISPRRRDLRSDLEKYGYKFFKPEDRNILTGIRKIPVKGKVLVH